MNERAHIFLTASIVFLLAAYPPVIAPVIILLVINWLCAPRLIIPGIKNMLSNTSLLAIVLLFLLYLTGMLYTNNYKIGFETIETKLSFIIFPLVFSAHSRTIKNNTNKYLKFFIYGTIVNAIICFGWATYRFIKPVYVELYGAHYDLGASYFYYNQLSVFLHPSYIAMYSIFALISIFYLVNSGELKFNWKWTGSTILLIVFILLLSSKAGWISLFLLALYFFRLLILKKRPTLALLIIGLLIGLFTFFNIYFTPRFLTRIPKLSVITETIKGFTEDNKKVTTSTDGTGSRILVWRAATEIIKDNFWLGTGTGDAKDKMLEKYKEKGMTSEYENKLNSHNQYLNTFVAMGVVGFIALLLCFVVPFYFSYKEKMFLFLAFIIIIVINFLVESMLETQAGVIFFAFFYSLLCFSLSDINPKSKILNPKSP